MCILPCGAWSGHPRCEYSRIGLTRSNLVVFTLPLAIVNNNFIGSFDAMIVCSTSACTPTRMAPECDDGLLVVSWIVQESDSDSRAISTHIRSSPLRDREHLVTRISDLRARLECCGQVAQAQIGRLCEPGLHRLVRRSPAISSSWHQTLASSVCACSHSASLSKGRASLCWWSAPTSLDYCVEATAASSTHFAICTHLDTSNSLSP